MSIRKESETYVARKAGMSAAIAVLLVATSLLIAVSPRTAAPVAYPIRASNQGLGAEHSATIATGPNGEVYVLFYYSEMGTILVLGKDSDGIWPEGYPIFNTWTVINDGGSFVSPGMLWPRTSMAVSASGDIYVVWPDNRDSATTGTDIRFSMSTDQGTTFTPSVRVTDTPGVNTEWHEDIAIAPNGEIWVTWVDMVGGGFNVYYTRSLDNGLSWQPGIRVNDGPGGSTLFSSLAFDSRGTVYIIWYDGNYVPPAVIMDFSMDYGATWHGDMRISQVPECAFGDIAVDSRDIVHVSYKDLANGPIYYTQSIDHGFTWSMQLRLDDNNNADSFSFPVIAVDDTGRVSVAWQDFDGVNFRPRYATSNSWGVNWGGESALVSDTGEVPAIYYSKERSLYISYTKDEGAPNGYESWMMWRESGPHPVTDLRAAPLPPPGAVQLTWVAPPDYDLQYYKIWQVDDVFSWTLVATVPSSLGTSFDLFGLSNGEYRYAVEAVDFAGQSSDPTFVTFTVGPTIEDLILGLQAQMSALQIQLATVELNLQTRIDALQTSITNLETNVTNLQTQLINVEANLQTRIDQIQNDLTNLALQVTSIQTEITNLQNQVSSLQTDVNSLQSQVNFLLAFVDGMNATIQNRINTLQTEIDYTQTQITGLQSQITTLQTTLTSIQTQMTAMNQDLADAIDELGSDLGGVQDKMATKDDVASAQNMLMILLIIVLVVSILSMVLSLRKPKIKQPEQAQPPQTQMPPQQYPPQQPP